MDRKAIPQVQELVRMYHPAMATWFSPLGNNWYDSLQVMFTKHISHNLDVTSNFTHQKELCHAGDAIEALQRLPVAPPGEREHECGPHLPTPREAGAERAGGILQRVQPDGSADAIGQQPGSDSDV